MANRRMFSIDIINSARFLRMPMSCRLLYYDLGMRADDDGVVEAYPVIRATGAAEADLNALAEKGFIEKINDELVFYISDWKRNNLVRQDRYRPSIYHEWLEENGKIKKNKDIEKGEMDTNGMTDGKPLVNQVTTNCIQSGNQRLTQVRLGKDSIGKDSLGEDSIEKKKESTILSKKQQPRNPHGEFGWVKLTDDEYQKLQNDLGNEVLSACIQLIDESAESTGNKNKWKNWNLVIRRCAREGWYKRRGYSQQQSSKQSYAFRADEHKGDMDIHLPQEMLDETWNQILAEREAKRNDKNGKA